MSRPAIAYLICYDIADPRRLVRVHKFLRTRAYAVQYSVFVGRLTRKALAMVMAGLAKRIDSSRDDVRIYPLPERPLIVGHGQSLLPEGVVVGTEVPLVTSASARASRRLDEKQDAPATTVAAFGRGRPACR